MGTSSSGSGPGDKTPLLPSWALPGADEDGAEDDGAPASDVSDADAADDAVASPSDGSDGDNSTSDHRPPAGGGMEGDDGAADVEGVEVDPSAPTKQVAPRANWASAKRRLGSVATRGGGQRRIASAGRAYVRARGGAKTAARSSVGSRSATARLGGFLSDVSSRGVGPALEALGLRRFAGHDANTIFAAIVDALAPEGADLEQVAAREAIEQTLAGLFEEYVTADGNVAALEAMTPDAIRSAIEASVAASIFNRWLGDLERVLEEKAVSAWQAVKLERDVEAYIRNTVKLDLQSMDPLTMQWDGPEGQGFIDRVYQDAYSILGGARS